MNLSTGKAISRYTVKEIPITQQIIDRVEEFAERDGMKPDLVFKNRKGELLQDDDLLKIHDMMEELGSDIYPKWEQFATVLGMEPGIIGDINIKERGDGERCLMRVLEKWRANPPPEYPFTMESVVTILRKQLISLNYLASQIEHKSC